MNKIVVLPLAVGITAIFSSSAGATDAPPLLEEIVVSGSRAETRLSETPVAIGRVERDEIERDKPKTIGEVINRIPGVSWTDLGNEQHSMAIRQPISTNPMYQYLEDGIPIRPLGVFNHNALNEMNLNGTDSVEVVKGAASSLYGSNAVGGAINFLTAAPSRTPTATLGYRYDNIAKFSRIDTGASNTWGEGVGAFGLRFSHYSSRRERDNWQDYSYGDKDSFTLRGDYVLSPSSLLRATVVHTDLDTAMTGSLFENNYRNRPGYSLNSFTYRKDKNTRATLAWEGETIANGLTTVTAFSRRNDHGQLPSYTITGCVGATCRGTINNNHVESLGIDIKHQQEFDWLRSRLVAGVYYDRSDNPYVSDNLSITRDVATGKYVSYTTSPLQTGRRDYQADITNVAWFAQWEFTPMAKTRIVVGGRSDDITYDFTNHLAPGGSADYGAPNEKRSFARFSPKIGATYELNRNASLYANLSEGFTPPEVSQLYSKLVVPNLKPATYGNMEIGLRAAFLGGALKFDSALYRLDGHDTIVSFTIAPGNSINQNAGRTRSQGVELGLTWNDGGAFDARFGTAIATHKFLKYQASPTLDYSGKEMPQAPAHVTSAELGYKPLANARVALEVVSLGEYWMNNANTVRYGGHTLFNARGSYALQKGVELWVQGRNLTDEHYADSASSSYSGLGVYSPNTQNQYTVGAPRSVMVGLTWNYEAKHP